MELYEIEKIVKERLSEKRYKHSLGVMERCEELAKKYNVDIERAKKTGLCHDIAKELSNEEKIKYVTENNIEIDEIEIKNIGLLHAKIGADIAKKEFGLDDEMAEAIKAHTTGLPNMGTLSKILFIADRTSKERDFSDIELINEILEKNLDEAILYILDKKIEIQLKKRESIHPNGVITRNKILELL